ncbi:hypothetical protein EV646_11099 [Kribbella antiqua]|uniref:Uncharacterized protein n=1 Tax=Kribbella antiqua TaxID=2512217 RepID=A0A4R2IJE6_9ACTN|nr:hypothetical protein EV646_11099 [Kribbella antiqua]
MTRQYWSAYWMFVMRDDSATVWTLCGRLPNVMKNYRGIIP